MSGELQLLRSRVERLHPAVQEYKTGLLDSLKADKPESALALARMVAETLAKQLLLDLKLDTEAMLDACLRKLEEPTVMSRGLVPLEMISLLHAARVLGNKATHNVLRIRVSGADVGLILGCVLRVLEWYAVEFVRGPKLDSVFAGETPPDAPDLRPVSVELAQLPEESIQTLGQVLSDGPLLMVLRKPPPRDPVVVRASHAGILRLRFWHSPFDENVIWDLQAELRILTIHREHVRILNETIARGGLGTAEGAYLMARGERLREVEKSRGQIRQYLDALIESAEIVVS